MNRHRAVRRPGDLNVTKGPVVLTEQRITRTEIRAVPPRQFRPLLGLTSDTGTRRVRAGYECYSQECVSHGIKDSTKPLRFANELTPPIRRTGG